MEGKEKQRNKTPGEATLHTRPSGVGHKRGRINMPEVREGGTRNRDTHRNAHNRQTKKGHTKRS